MQKTAVAIALSIVFTVASITVLFNTAKVVDSVLTAYVFEVEDEYCEYYPRPVPENEQIEKPACEVNYVRAKREIITGSSWLAVALVASSATYREIRRLLKQK